MALILDGLTSKKIVVCPILSLETFSSFSQNSYSDVSFDLVSQQHCNLQKMKGRKKVRLMPSTSFSRVKLHRLL